jgi:hypothetical protein
VRIHGPAQPHRTWSSAHALAFAAHSPNSPDTLIGHASIPGAATHTAPAHR